MQLRNLLVVQVPLGCGRHASLQTAGEAAFQHTAVNSVVVGRKLLQDVKALEIRPQLQRDAEAGKLALPGLGELLVGAAAATGGQYDAPGRAGLEDDDGEPQRENDANERTANYDQKLSHAPAQCLID